MKTLLFCVCDSVIVDARSNRATIMNILEDLRSREFPFEVFGVSAIAMFEKEGDDDAPPASIALYSGDDLMLEAALEVEFGRLKKCRVVIDIDQIEVPNHKDLRFTLSVDGDVTAEWRVAVRRVRDGGDTS